MSARWLVFDAMGVVFEVGDDVEELLIPYVRARRPAIAPERIRSAYREASLGMLEPSGFWQAVRLGAEYPEVERDYLDAALRIDPLFVPVAERLSASWSLGLLSNDVPQWSAYARARFGLDRLFGAVVISGEIGCRKPDPAIYAALLERTGAAPADCVLVDDRPANVEAALRVGMKAVRFVREARAVQLPGEIATFRDLPAALDLIAAGS